MENILGTSWALWTNLAFLVPLYIALANKLWLHALFITLTTVLSFMYHVYSGHRFELEDEMAAVALIAVNAVLVVTALTRHNNPQWFIVTVVAICVSLTLLYIENKFPGTHGFWHIFSAIVTIACQFFFLDKNLW